MHTWVVSVCSGSAFPRQAFAFTVHSIFPRALNLRPTEGFALVSLVSAPSLAHPRAAVVPGAAFDEWGLAAEGAGWFDGQVLRFDGGAVVSLAPTRRQAAQEAVGPLRVSSLGQRRTLRTAAAAIQALRVGRYTALPGYEDRLAMRASVLEAAVACQSVSQTVEAFRGLVGLGPGLTPAGDDFLCGYLAGLRSQATGDPSLARFVMALETAFREAPDLLAATNDISAAFLAEAFEGRFGAALVAFAEAALGLTGELDEAVAVLGALGHSSGTDAAAGFLFAFRQEIGG